MGKNDADDGSSLTWGLRRAAVVVVVVVVVVVRLRRCCSASRPDVRFPFSASQSFKRLHIQP